MPEMLFFYGGVFSQWHPSVFTDGERTFTHAEQYMMWSKAKLFGDDVAAKKIMKAQHPREQKALGREVRWFDENTWKGCAKGFVRQGNLYKFGQNRAEYDELMASAPKLLVEASPTDKIWGIGLSEDDPARFHRGKWRGTNWLGEVLTDVRDSAELAAMAKEQGWI